MTKVCVLGLGYIGLPTSLLLANAGHQVVGVDVNETLVNRLKRGELPYEEQGLDSLFKGAIGNFMPQTQVETADVFLIAVPTPLDSMSRVADLKYVKSAAKMIVPFLRDGNLVIVESTVPPGTAENVVLPIIQQGNGYLKNVHLAHCPERAIPGHVIEEMTNNPRIIGGNDNVSLSFTKGLYASFVKGEIIQTDLRTAEFVKLMENTYRDVNIALINDFAKLADENRIDIWEARDIANKHPRVAFVKPGPGVGGHCIAVDPWFLIGSTACRIISVSRDINDTMPNYVLKLVKRMIKGISNPVVTVLGVAYKGNVSDTRETPANKFIMLSENEGIKIKCHDPLVNNFEPGLMHLEEATEGSDCIVLIADHDVFKEIDPESLRMRNKNLVDTRNTLEHEKWKNAGFSVKVLGCGKEE